MHVALLSLCVCVVEKQSYDYNQLRKRRYNSLKISHDNSLTWNHPLQSATSVAHNGYEKSCDFVLYTL